MTGNFSFQSGAIRNGIARLGSNGDLDQTYAANIGADGVVYTLAIRTNGNVIIGGAFTTFNFVPRRGVAQLDSYGDVDPAFDPEGGINDRSAVFTMMLQADEKLMIGGSFTSFNDIASTRIARLDTNGTLMACDTGFGANDNVSSFVKHASGKIVIGGLFTSFNDADRHAIAQIKGEPPPSRLGPPSQRPDGSYQFALYGENQVDYRVEASSNLLNWISITNFTAINQPAIIVDPDGSAHQTRFYRALSLP
jgi:hypothetical protein